MSTESRSSAKKEETVMIPTNRQALQRISLEDDFHETIKKSSTVINSIQTGTTFFKNLFGDSSNAISKIFGSINSLGSSSLDKLSMKPSLIAGVAGLGGIYTGLASVKNLFKTIGSFSDPKSDPVSWIVYGLQSILEAGLTIGLTAPFFNIKNPFAKIINGKEVVQYKTLISAAVVPFFISTYISMAKNNFFILRIPIIGKLIKEITNLVTDALKHLSTNTGDQNAIGQAPPQMPNLGG